MSYLIYLGYRVATVSALFMLFSFSHVHAQDGAGDKKFSNGDISFEYPSNWRVSDKSSKDVQQFNLVPNNGNVLIIVSVYRKKVTSTSGFAGLKSQVSKPRVGRIASGFSTFTERGECVLFKDKNIPGQVISGLHQSQPTTNSSFSFVMNGRFVHLLYLREDRDGVRADPTWQNFLRTLQIKGAKNSGETLYFDMESDEYLNGRAIKLPKPIYSLDSKYRTLLPMTVTVRVTIDENGDVVSAKAITGIRELHFDSETAAKKAKFLPARICGEISQITGTIAYHFTR